MIERLGNTGYLGLVVEPAKGTATIPTDYIPFYEETLTTSSNFVDQKPAYGTKHEVFQTIQGQRSHEGDVTLLAEPNTTARLMDMLYTKSSSSGTNPTTHSFILSATAPPKSYTVDVSTGNTVKRFCGVEASSYSPTWNDNELQHKLKLSALYSFQGAVVTSVTGSGPYTVALDTTYDPNPTKGLVVGDSIGFYDVSADTTINATIATIATASITTVTNPTAITAGDLLQLRPSTPAFNLLPSFTWAATEFRFGATASAALSGSQLRVEKGSTFELNHSFEDTKGAPRSGGLDPAALVRLTGSESITIKKFFDTPQDLAPFQQLSKQSLVIRHFSGASRQYEFRVTFNNVKYDTPMPTVKAGEINYSSLVLHPNYDQTDGKAVQIDVLDTLTAI